MLTSLSDGSTTQTGLPSTSAINVFSTIDGETPSEQWGFEDPRVVWVAELGRFVITCTAYGPAGPAVFLATTEDFTTVELKANVFRAGREGDVLTAVGHPLHVGRRTQVWEVRIMKEGRNAAFFTCTQMVLA